ncbi:MAG: hypothetical protein IJW24_02930 [Clostridia bacterium]|nr:hypothetical protein [Clostridia bacterium]
MATKKNLNEILAACMNEKGDVDLTKFEAEVADFLHEAGMTDREARQRVIAVSKFLATETNADIQLSVARAYVSKRGDLDTTQTAEGFITQATAHVAKLESEKRTTGDYAGLNTKAIKTVLTTFASALVDERYRESNAVLSRENAGLHAENARLLAALEIASRRATVAESSTETELERTRGERDTNAALYLRHSALVKSVFEKVAATMPEDQREAYYVLGADGEKKLDMKKVIADDTLVSLVDNAISKSFQYEIYADVVEKVFEQVSRTMTAEEIAEYYEEFDGPDGKALRLNMDLVVADDMMVSKIDEAITKAMNDLPRERRMRKFWTGAAAVVGVLGVAGTLTFGIISSKLSNQVDDLTKENTILSENYEQAAKERAALREAMGQILDAIGNNHEDLKGTFENEDGTYNINDIIAVLNGDHAALDAAIQNFNNAMNDYENAATFAQNMYDEISSILTEEQKAKYFVDVTDENGNVTKEFDLEAFMADDELAGAIVSEYLIQSTLHEADDVFNDLVLELIGSDMSIDAFMDENGNLDVEALETEINNQIDPYIAELEKILEQEENFPTMTLIETQNLQAEVQELKEQKADLIEAIVSIHEEFVKVNGEKSDLQAELDALKSVLENQGQSPEQNESATPEQGAGSVSDATENGMEEDTTQSGGSGSSNKGNPNESNGELGA